MVETSTRVEGRVFTHNVGWVPEHLKHPLKTVDRYWSPVSDRDQMANMGGVVAPHIPIMVMWRATRFCFSFSCFWFSCFGFHFRMEWWMALYGRGPPIWWTTIGHIAPASFSFLDLEVRPTEQWSSVGALSNQLPQVITYHRYASLRGTSSLEMGVVLCPHVSGRHQDRKVFVPYL